MTGGEVSDPREAGAGAGVTSGDGTEPVAGVDDLLACLVQESVEFSAACW